MITIQYSLVIAPRLRRSEQTYRIGLEAVHLRGTGRISAEQDDS